MGGIERRCERREEPQRLLQAERALSVEQAPQVLSLDVAHGQKQLTLHLSCLIEGNDAGVVERGTELRLSQEALPEVLVFSQSLGQELERHLPAELLLQGEVDDTHAALSQQPLQPEAGDSGAERDTSRHRGGTG